MKIALSTSVIQRGKTGIAQYVFALVQAMLQQAENHEIYLLVLEEDLPLFAFAKGRATLVPVKESWRPALKNIFWHQFVLPRWLKEHGIDVLHVPSYRRMVWNAPCATVSTIHDLAPFHVKGKYDLARMIYGRVIVKHLARKQDAVVAISQNTARDIERFFGIPQKRQNIILNGLDHLRFHPELEMPQQEPTDPSAAPFFLYISRLEHPAKNHVRLIEAFNRFKAATDSPWQLVLGGSDWHGAEHIHAAAAASPYSKDIRFLGFVPDSDLPGLYRRAGALVYPSLFEGFGMPPVEAMACGCPVISSAAGSLTEVVGDAALIIDPESIDSIQNALAMMASDPNTRQRLIHAGFANSYRFDWRDNARKVLKIYRKCVPSLGGVEARVAESETEDEIPSHYARPTSTLATRHAAI
ncbi:Glycosyltransferase involved in cell wall bisynthesis [Prosthecobacter debontii]|uniref:Glycosyltransferase involved in cell wall bisynthesis n=1 Tax=Prosthecobacter debontii TaxID=48467 RepID=A0A1T4XUP5_9BACT|nr:glycosyltransferase family 1 protein [Prosthecobacter debontii]SKA93123.1 Glycosyltransferase involved in cell wall bisynthesis [Prosthecobacter debontii]